MRLLNVDTKELKEFQDDSIPPYAILSHTWREEEVTFQDMHVSGSPRKVGYAKILGCCDQAKADQLQYVWIDNCCIDKSSSSELSEAINSMYRWYKQASYCYVFLDDYSATGSGHLDQASSPCGHYRVAREDQASEPAAPFCSDCFRQCRWFTRGWTLQELLAPTSLKFYDRSWICIGYARKQQPNFQPHNQVRHLGHDLKVATGIPIKYINHEEHCSLASVAQRFSWASKRHTSRAEDMAYCLLGLFDVHMPLLYGEGLRNAFIRLQEEIMKVNDDQSMFAWGLKRSPTGLGWDHSDCFEELRFESKGLRPPNFHAGPLLSISPTYFENSWNIIPSKRSTINTGEPHSMTNRGLRIDTHFLQNEVVSMSAPSLFGLYEKLSYVALGCVEENNPYCFLAMCVIHLEGNIYARALCERVTAAVIAWPKYIDKPLRSIYLLQEPQSYATSAPRGPKKPTYLLRDLPKNFGPYLDDYPSGCWNQEKGTISIPLDAKWAVLIFPLANQRSKAIALAFRCSGFGILSCHLELISLPCSAERKLASYTKNNTLEGKTISGVGEVCSFTIPGKVYCIRTTEDLVLGGVYRLHIEENDRK